ncbi:MAG: hypothetical protein WDO69_30540 [Pseudomonadota bacterium]
MKDYSGQRRSIDLLLAGALLAGACAGTGTAGERTMPAADASSSEMAASCPAEQMTTAEARSLIDKYCVSCHSPDGAAGEDYDFRGDPAIIARRRNIEANLRLHAMPPPGARQPSDTERAALRCWAKE